jgi:hypothetical protein
MLSCITFHKKNLQGNQCVRGRNIEIDKVEVTRIDVKNFLSQTFKINKFQVTVFVAKKCYVSFLLMLQVFVNQFIFIWGRE